MHVSSQAVEVVVFCIIRLGDSISPKREWFQGASVLSRLLSPRQELSCPSEKTLGAEVLSRPILSRREILRPGEEIVSLGRE